MNQFIKINNIVFNLAQIISIDFTPRKLYGEFNEGCETIPQAIIKTSENKILGSESFGSNDKEHIFFGKDANEIQEWFGNCLLTELGANVTYESFYSESEQKRLEAIEHYEGDEEIPY